MTTTSESLLFRLQQGGQDQVQHTDQEAWEEFVALYTPLMFFWARKMGLDQASAADLVQEVMARVFQKLPQFRYDRSGSFRGWLRKVTLNRYRELRRLKSHGESPASRSMIENMLPVEVAESTWDIDYARLLVGQAMEEMRDDFAPATWEALVRVIQQHEKIEEVSSQSGVSTWTIYSARSRMMRRLREQLEGLL